MKEAVFRASASSGHRISVRLGLSEIAAQNSGSAPSQSPDTLIGRRLPGGALLFMLCRTNSASGERRNAFTRNLLFMYIDKPCLSSFASDYPAVTGDYVPDALRRIGSASRVVATHLSHLTKTRPFARNPVISGDRAGSRFAVIFRHRITYAFV